MRRATVDPVEAPQTRIPSALGGLEAEPVSGVMPSGIEEVAFPDPPEAVEPGRTLPAPGAETRAALSGRLVPVGAPETVAPLGPERLAPRQEESGAPVIRVTIGRVDVRAVLPPEPASKAAPLRPAPRLSLDDYLKRQNGGAR